MRSTRVQRFWSITGALGACLSLAQAETGIAQVSPRRPLQRSTAPTVRAIASTAVRSAPLVLTRAAVPVAPLRALTDSGTAPIVATTKGGDVVVLQIPLPATIRLDAALSLRPIQYRVSPGRHVQLLGQAVGQLRGGRDTSLVLAVRVARRAPAGRSLGGTVEFSVGTVSATVPFELDVAAQRQLTLGLSTRTLLATRGRWSTLPIRVTNAGNVEEVTSLSVGVPRGWRAEVQSSQRTQRLAAGSVGEYRVRLFVPSQANAGLVLLPVRLVRPGERDTTEQLQVDVMADLQNELRGARVTTSAVAGHTADGLTTSAYGVSLDGQLSDSTSVSGRFAYAASASVSDSRGLLLARTGIISGPPSFEIRNPHFELSAGATTVLGTELGGQNLAGIGGSVLFRKGRIFSSGFQLRPFSLAAANRFLTGGRGSMQGAEIGIRTTQVRASLFGSALQEEFTRRSLVAYGMRFAAGQPSGTNVQTEVAYRDAGLRRGLGSSVSLQRTGGRTFFEGRVLHAPGGSEGFARALDEVSLSTSRGFGDRGFVAIGGWHQRDESRQMGAVRNLGWSVAPALSISGVGTVGLEARGGKFATAIEGSQLHNDELSGGGMWSTDVAGATVIARSTLARIERRYISEGAENRFNQLRVDHSISAMRSTSRGSLQANWNFQQFAAAGQRLPSQQGMQLRLEQFRPRLSDPIHFDGEVQRIQLGPSSTAFWAARASVTAELPIGFNITLAAERSPFAVMSRGRDTRAFGYTLRVDRVIGTPRLFSGARNRVFRDDNGNGKQDRGERGVPGVVIQCGARRVQSDASGRYTCAEREQRLDGRSVPVGLVASGGRIDVGHPVALRVMHPLRVELRLGGNDTLRVRAQDLDGAVVYARDSTGANWYARSLGGGAYLIDAIGVGRFTIGVDGSGLAEPLTMVAAEPVVLVDGRERPAPIVLEMRARPVRLKTFDGNTGGLPATQPAPAPTRKLRRAPLAIRLKQSVTKSSIKEPISQVKRASASPGGGNNLRGAHERR